MRPRTACTACRRRQRRCIFATSGSACTYCAQRDLPCSLSTPSSAQPSESVASKHSPSAQIDVPLSDSLELGQTIEASDVALPPLDVCIDIALAYFAYVHDPSHHLFHQPTFLEDLRNGQISSPILLCVVAIAARFSTKAYFYDTEPRARGEIYIQQAAKMLNVHDISADTVRTAILLGAYYGADGDALHENVYYTIACRMACLVRIPNLQDSGELDRELDIRLWWTLVMVDIWASNNTQLPHLLPSRDDVPYPCSETKFRDMRRDVATESSLLELREIPSSILAETIKLNVILTDIARLLRASANHELGGLEAVNSTELLASRLINWYNHLPPDLTYTQKNLVVHASSGCGETVMSPSLQNGMSYAEECRNNSSALCETIYNAYATPGAEVYYSMVGHVLVIASTVQLHILLFSDDPTEISAARNRLARNFQILCELQTIWRALDVSFDRFRTFHAACMSSMNTDISVTMPGGRHNSDTSDFRLDHWMVGFLMEFSKPIVERPGQDPELAGFDLLNGSGFGHSGNRVDWAIDLHQWSKDTLGIDLEM